MPKPKESSAGEATLRVGDGGTDETKEKLAQELAESTTKKKARASKSVKRSQNESPGKDKKRTKTNESGEHVGVATTQDNVDGTSEKALNQAKSADDLPAKAKADKVKTGKKRKETSQSKCKTSRTKKTKGSTKPKSDIPFDQQILAVLKRNFRFGAKKVHFKEISREHGHHERSTNWINAFKQLTADGMVASDAVMGNYELTEVGIAHVANGDDMDMNNVSCSQEAYEAYLKGRLKMKRGKEIFDLLKEHGSLARKELAALIGISDRSHSFSGALKELKEAGLLDVDPEYKGRGKKHCLSRKAFLKGTPNALVTAKPSPTAEAEDQTKEQAKGSMSCKPATEPNEKGDEMGNPDEQAAQDETREVLEDSAMAEKDDATREDGGKEEPQSGNGDLSPKESPKRSPGEENAESGSEQAEREDDDSVKAQEGANVSCKNSEPEFTKVGDEKPADGEEKKVDAAEPASNAPTKAPNQSEDPTSIKTDGCVMLTENATKEAMEGSTAMSEAFAPCKEKPESEFTEKSVGGNQKASNGGATQVSPSPKHSTEQHGFSREDARSDNEADDTPSPCMSASDNILNGPETKLSKVDNSDDEPADAKDHSVMDDKQPACGSPSTFDQNAEPVAKDKTTEGHSAEEEGKGGSSKLAADNPSQDHKTESNEGKGSELDGALQSDEPNDKRPSSQAIATDLAPGALVNANPDKSTKDPCEIQEVEAKGEISLTRSNDKVVATNSGSLSSRDTSPAKSTGTEEPPSQHVQTLKVKEPSLDAVEAEDTNGELDTKKTGTSSDLDLSTFTIPRKEKTRAHGTAVNNMKHESTPTREVAATKTMQTQAKMAISVGEQRSSMTQTKPKKPTVQVSGAAPKEGQGHAKTGKPPRAREHGEVEEGEIIEAVFHGNSF